MCNENLIITLSPRQCNVEGNGHKRQRGAGWEYLTKSKNTLESRGRVEYLFLVYVLPEILDPLNVL
jgi:hypothetical protein